ncbi:hypothetical protein [Actinomadura sp. BRA 177]|uniref:hypothetical protein n=1 Tax=Actinomadura sp. BRA 177 TaxID=2745202 RepID=UPI0015962200|nr:hypothetical protein [Actinomadura sp. BRA 177]NVI89892.1 hypothetical protein [Actinomadura sp. BRA 177]
MRLGSEEVTSMDGRAVLVGTLRGVPLLVCPLRGGTVIGARAVLHEAPSPVAVVHERDPNIKESS